MDFKRRKNFNAFFAKFLLILFLFFICPSNFVLSGKNQRMKHQNKVAKDEKTLWDIPPKQKTIKETRQCPEKGGKMAEKKKNDDDERTELVNNFKSLIENGGKIEKFDKLKMRINSLKWVLGETIGATFAFVAKIGTKMAGKREFLEEIEKWERKWTEIEEKEGKMKAEGQLSNLTVCLMYELSSKMVKTIDEYTQKDRLMVEQWQKFVKKRRVADIIRGEDNIHCDNFNAIVQMVTLLTSPSRIYPIFGLILFELLENNENFRHFLCHEVTEIKEMKVAINYLTNGKYLTLLENEFPEILRVDFLMVKTTFYRLQQMLLNRSNSEQYISAFLQFTSAVMINQMKQLSTKLLGTDQSNISLILRLFVVKINAAAKDAFRHFGSSLQLCVMNKIMNFVDELEEKGVENLTEKSVKKLRMKECEEEKVQWRTMRDAMDTRLGLLISHAISELAVSEADKVRSVFKHPGTKMRLLRLVGTDQRVQTLADKFNLAPIFADNALVNDNLFWAHYLHAMCRGDKVERQSHKFGADLAVFVRWLWQKFAVERRLNSLFRLIRDYISDFIYEPIFDANQTGLMGGEKFLEEKLFFATKKMAENLTGKVEEKSEKLFEKWKLIVEKKEGTEKAKNGEMEKAKRWRRKMHAEQMRRLLKNGKMEQLESVVNLFGTEIIRKNLLQFFDENEIEKIFKEFGIGNKEAKIGNLEYFELFYDEDNDEEEEEEEEKKEKKEGKEEKKEEKKEKKEGKVEKKEKEGKEGKEEKGEKEENDRKKEDKERTDQQQREDKSDNENRPKNECSIGQSNKCQNSTAEDLDLHSLMDHLINLFWKMKDETSTLPKIGLLKNSEMRATIFYYRQSIDELFKFGQMQLENDLFEQKIGIYKEKWEKIKIIGPKNDGKLEEKMCKIYQFVHEIVTDDELKKISKKWAQNLAEKVTEFGKDLFEQTISGHIILLAEHSRQWHQIDCSIRQNAEEFVEKVRLNCHQLIEGVYVFVMDYLIRNSGQMRDLLANGTEKNILWMKHKIILSISHRVLDRLEMLHPKVMHYDHLTVTSLTVLLIKQFEFKSDTLEAQNAFARCSSPFLLNSIEKLEEKLRENCKKTTEDKKIGEILLEKIESEKQKFYTKLKKANEENKSVRKAFCPLFMLSILGENISNGTVKVGNSEAISEWSTKKCEKEQNVKDALGHFVPMFSARLFVIFDENPNDFQKLCKKIAEIPGGKTRLFKLLNTEANTALLPDITDENWMVKTLWTDEDKMEEQMLFNNDLTLCTLYIELFIVKDPMRWLNIKMKLDLIVFVRLTDAKILDAIEKNATVSRRFANFWTRNKFVFVQFYDRLFDENENEMENIKIFQINFLNELNLFFEKNLNAKNAKIGKGIEKEMRKIIEKSQRKFEEKSKNKSNFGGENWNFEEKLIEIHSKTIKELMEKNKYMKKLIKNVDKAEIGKINLEILERIELSENEQNLGEKSEISEENIEFWEEKNTKIKEKKKKGKQKRQKNGAKTEEKFTKTMETVDTVTEEQQEKGDNITVEDEEDTVKGGQTKDTVEKEEKGEKENKEEENTVERRQTKDTVEEDGGKESKGEENTVERRQTKDTIEEKGGKKSKEEENTVERRQTKDTVEEEEEGEKKESEEIGEQINLGENERKLKLDEFGDDNFLALKYDEFLEKIQKQNEEKSVEMLIKQINLGILTNEILNRKKAMEKEKEKEWEEKEEKHLEKHLEKQLEKQCQKLKQILGEVEENGEKCDEIIQQMHSRKLGMAINEGKVKNWHKMSEKGKKLALLKLLNGKSETILAKFERNLEFLERAKTQRKLDQNLFFEYKNNANLSELMGEKDKCQFYKNNSKLLATENLQELNSAEKKEKIIEEIEKVKKELKLNDGEKNGKELAEIRKIFNEWSDVAHFQFPSLFFLRNLHKKFETICILPEEFEHKLIFGGDSNCEKTDDGKNGKKCSDNSLFCALRKKFNSISIQKYSKNHFSNVPSVQIVLPNVQIDVKFVKIPEFGHIPRKNFSAKQLEVFLLKFGKNIEKMEKNDHFDEGVYWHEIRTREKLRKNLENGQETAYESKSAANNANELEQFDKITELFHQSREKALGQRKMVKARKEALLVLAENATNLKLLQFILPKNNYLAILERFELDDDFGIKTMDKFRTIFAYLEKWAKNNHIFCDALGYLNNRMLLLMLTKVFLLFPNSSMSFLIDKFFLIYSKWNWPMAVQLSKISERKFGDFLSWSPFREWFCRRQFAWKNFGNKMESKKKICTELLAMAVITPTFPEQNVAENVNISSAKVLKWEIKKALEKIRKRKAENGLIEPIRPIKFTEKFENFVVVKCIGTIFNVENFCDFVGKRLRYELLEFVEKPLAFWVDFCQVFPKMITPSMQSPADKAQNDNDNKISMVEKAWIVGIRMESNRKANGNFKRKLKNKLNTKFEAKVQWDFEKGNFHNVKLKAEVASGDNLQNWIIEGTKTSVSAEEEAEEESSNLA